jgi:hypothetical protein
VRKTDGKLKLVKDDNVFDGKQKPMLTGHQISVDAWRDM